MKIDDVVVGDCRATLARWAAEGVRVQCVVTSPPYWGLRDYGTAPLVWGGAPACGWRCKEYGHHPDRHDGAGAGACAHAWGEEGHSGQRLRNGEGSDTAKQAVPVTLHPSTGATCANCGAWRGHLGLEPTPELAQDLGRAWLGCELSEEYAALCERRTRQQGLTLVQ